MTVLTNLLALAFLTQAQAFVPQHNAARPNIDSSLHIFDKIGEFFEELDAFVDDATSRRLGAGASFYGKRKSKFYGKDDTGRKRDKEQFDPTGEFENSVALGKASDEEIAILRKTQVHCFS
jgi:hypothetical protein